MAIAKTKSAEVSKVVAVVYLYFEGNEAKTPAFPAIIPNLGFHGEQATPASDTCEFHEISIHVHPFGK